MGLQEIRKRIRSVQSTHKLTAAMKLIAASRLRQVTRLLTAARSYETSLKEAIQKIFETFSAQEMERCCLTLPKYYLNDNTKKPHIICVVGAHSGLCGSYNLFSIRETLAEEARTKNRAYSIVPFSAKTAEYFAKNRPDQTEPLAGLGHFEKHADPLEIARYVLEHMERWFANDEAGSVSVVSGHFKNALVQEIETFSLFPLSKDFAFLNKEGAGKASLKNEEKPHEFVIEPLPSSALQQSLRHFALVKLYGSLLESEACECAARMTMMESAQHNAEELIDKLSLQYNRTRQANITNELIEIIAGTNAMANDE